MLPVATAPSPVVEPKEKIDDGPNHSRTSTHRSPTHGSCPLRSQRAIGRRQGQRRRSHPRQPPRPHDTGQRRRTDRKSTRLNSSHVAISYAVFCLKKKTNTANST